MLARQALPRGRQSPDVDAEKGGAGYLYTRFRERSRPRGQFSWSAAAFRRADVRSHDHDNYHTDILRRGDRVGTNDLARVARTSETLFKNGLSIFDDGFEFWLPTRGEVDDLIGWVRTQGKPFSQGLWPDGRKLEEVILVAGRRL